MLVVVTVGGLVLLLVLAVTVGYIEGGHSGMRGAG